MIPVAITGALYSSFNYRQVARLFQAATAPASCTLYIDIYFTVSFICFPLVCNYQAAKNQTPFQTERYIALELY